MARRLSAMTASILLLVLTAVLVVAAVRARRGGFRFAEHNFQPAAPFVGVLPVDRDRERLIADLRAHPEAPANIHLRLRRPYPFV